MENRFFSSERLLNKLSKLGKLQYLYLVSSMDNLKGLQIKFVLENASASFLIDIFDGSCSFYWRIKGRHI